MRRRISAVLLVALIATLVPAQHHQTNHATPGVSPDTVWAELVAGNKRFVNDAPATREYSHTREKLAKGQAPKAIVVTCSDSRVPPELIFDVNLGEIFVVRAAGNIADKFGVGSIEYAIEHLGSNLIVVLGHESCGAVNAACAGKPLPEPNLSAIGNAIAPACKRGADHSVDAHASVAANVAKSAADIVADSEVIREAVHSGKVQVVRAVYSLGTGQVVRLP